MLLLAYLFCDMLYVGPSTAYWSMAETIFGRDLAQGEVNKLRAQLLAAGYAGDRIKDGRLRWITALCMLVNWNPLVETFSAQLLVTVDELLPEIAGTGHIQGRWALLRVQMALCSLGILDEPVLLDRSQQKTSSLPALWQNDPTVDPTWLAWVCAFYDQTPTYDERRRRQMCYSLLKEEQGLEWQKDYLRRLCETDPQIHETYELIHEFTTMVRERRGEWFDAWLARVEQQAVAELQSFAQGLQKDYDAVKVGLTLPWSQGQVEGQIHRLKLLKRQSYGRAHFDLLRHRVLARSV